MKQTHKYLRKRKKSFPWIAVLSLIAAVLAIVVACLISRIPQDEKQVRSIPTAPAPTATEQTSVPTENVVPTTEETTLPPETEPQILPYFVDMAAQNPDMIGWIKIDGTKLDYPLMYTPDDEEKYLHRDFDGNFSVGGLPFIGADCSLEPRSDNLILYGHNMANGTMFHSLMNYDQKNYWQEHPVIHMSSLYEETEYEIIAAFYDQIYLKSDTCFKFYQFIDAEDETAFNEAITYFKEHALYDTGVTAEYGDKLITLVTCAYHVDNGRFVVVAKESAQS